MEKTFTDAETFHANSAYSIEIGGGKTDLPAHVINLDPVHGKGHWKREAQRVPWPVEENSADRIRACHVMEHIPAGADRIAVMNEAWRVLKPGALFQIIVPLLFTGNGIASVWSIADPTHVSYWCQQSFSYFDGRMAACADYGLKLWKTAFYGEGDADTFYSGMWMGTPVK